MSKKTLLNENTVRRFMKLADMGTKSDNFINEMGYYQADEDEAMDDEPMDDMGDEPMDDMADEAPEMPGDEGPEDEPMADEAPEADDMAGDADEVEISEDEREVLAQAAEILKKIGGGGDMGDMDMDMGDEAGMRDMNMMEGEKEEDPMEEGAGMKHDEADDKALDEVEVVEEDELVQEVTRRVAARLRAAMKSRK